MYSIRNTPEPLKLKVRHTACLCPPCIADQSENCHNSHFTDPWKEVDLLPVKGESRRKHLKQKHLKEYVAVQNRGHKNHQASASTCAPVEVISDDESLPDIVLDNIIDDANNAVEELTWNADKNSEGIFINLTAGDTDSAKKELDITSTPLEVNDVILINDQEQKETMADLELSQINEFVPEQIYWESVLGSLERCSSDAEFEKVAVELSKTLKPFQNKETNVDFKPDCDIIDDIATQSIPSDGPKNLVAVKIKGDGNCMSRSLSHSYAGHDGMHLELRACIIIKGVVNKEKYISHEYLHRGATNSRDAETLPHLYVQYSDHYVNGQRITSNTVDYIYLRELHDCCKINSYMGLWQIAQAPSVLNVPIQSVFPEGTDPIMRHDFNRFFFPVNSTAENCTDLLIIMWTSVQRNSVPVHFVPLLPRRFK